MKYRQEKIASKNLERKRAISQRVSFCKNYYYYFYHLFLYFKKIHNLYNLNTTPLVAEGVY